MKLLVDSALSPIVAAQLRHLGHDVVHAREVGMQHALDEELLLFAGRQDRVIISADTDFGTLLTLRRMTKPSFVLLRRTSGNRPQQTAALLGRLLPVLAEDLQRGAIVTISDDRVRIRLLPVLPS